MENLNHLSDDPYLQQNLNIEFLISWVNQFQNYPHCSQAIDLSDFQSGIIFCELVYDVVLQRKGGSFLSKVITSNLNQQRCIQNISLALQEINDPNLNLTPQQVYGDTEAIIQLIEYLQRIDKNQSNNDKPQQQNNQLFQQGIQQYKKPPLPNKMKLSGTYQENNKYSNGGGTVNNVNQYISPQFGIKQVKGTSGVGDELLEPDNESDAAYMENPYEMGLSQDNVYHQSNISFQNQTPGIQSNRSSQQNSKMIENDSKLRHQQEYMNNGQCSNSHRNNNYQAQQETKKQDEYGDASNDQVINIENIQKMSQSLSEYFKKQNSTKNTSNNFFNIQEDGYPVDVDSIQEGQATNQEQQQNTPLTFQKSSNSQKNDEFDQSARNTSSQTKFYQMNKMRPGSKPFQEQIIEVQGEVTHQEKLKNYQLENEQENDEDQPRQLPVIDNQYSNRNSFSQEVPHFPNQNNIFEETQPRKLNSVPTKEPLKYTPTKQNLIPMTMKDMAALQYPKKDQVKNQIHYQDVKNILNNKYGEEDNYLAQQKPKFKNEDRAAVNYFKNQKLQKVDSNNSQLQPQQYNSHSFNCSPQHKNSFIIDKFTSNKHCSEQKIKEAQEFLQKDAKEEKVNLKKILQGGVNISRISNKGDPLSATSNAIVLDIEIETVSEKTRSKLLNWLNDIKLLKQIPNLDQKLHKICKDGIIFADIINLMEGKNQIIKGLERKPKKEAQITANYLKIFNYLKNFDKMNPRYLSQQFLIQQNENIFWGFLDDLWNFYHNKISPNDIRYNGNGGSVIMQSNNHDTSQYSIINMNKQALSTQQQQTQQFQQAKLNTNTSHLSSNFNNNTQQTSQGGQLSSQRRSNSQIPPNNLKQIQEEEDSHQQSQVQQHQDFLGDATVTSSQYKRRQYEKYEDIMHGNHNEAKRKKSNQRSLKDNNSFTQGQANSVEQNINALLTDENIPFYQNQNNNLETRQLQHQQYNKKQGLSKSPSSANPLMTTLQNIDIDLIKNWLRGLGFSHMLNKSERLQEQYMVLREKQNEIANSEEDKNNQKNLRKKNTNGKLWGSYSEEEEKIITQDPLKNGVLLCLTLSRIEMSRVDQLYRKPETVEQCYKNYDLAYRNIRARTVFVPIELLWRQKEIFQGELYSLWQICHGLMLSTNSVYVSTQLEGQENQIPQQFQNQMNSLNNNQNQLNPSCIQNYSSQRFNYNTQNRQVITQNLFQSSSSSMIPTTFTNHAQQHVNPQQQLSQLPLNGTESIMQSNSSNQMTVNMQLPYSEESLSKLKSNLIEWVEYLGIFAELNVECADFTTFLSLCKEGAVLCYLMCKIFNIKIVGINRKACTKAAALSNIRKFLEIFKRTKDLPNIFFVTEESIYEMKEHLIIYLLEELMRYQDNIPSHQPNSIFQEPYLKVFPQKENAFAAKENAYGVRTNNAEISNQSTTTQQQNRSQQNPYYAKGSNNQPIEARPSMHNQSNRDVLKNYNENFLNQSQQNAIDNLNFVNSQRQNTSVSIGVLNNKNIKAQDINKNNFYIDDPYSILPQTKRIENLELNTMTSPTNIQVLKSINQQQQLTQTQRIEQVVQKNKIVQNITSSPIQKEDGVSVYNDFGSSDPDQGIQKIQKPKIIYFTYIYLDSLKIKTWLSSIGFEDLAYSLNFREQIIYQFKDGTILGKILEKLESKPLKGINLNPKNNANFKYNLSKCIEFLEKKSDMAQDLLWDQNELFECSSDFIKKFLLAIRYAYRKATLSLKRANGSSVSSQISQK
ncbi:hypothetical protein ABPG72_018951 [Tetrahymena utriculariae]